MTQFTTQRVLCWRVLLKEYNVTFHHKRGDDNVIADCLSCLPTDQAKVSTNPSDINKSRHIDQLLFQQLKHFPTKSDNTDMFFETPIFDINNIFCQPFNPTDIEYYQNNDKPLKKQCKDNPEEYRTVQIDKAIIVVRLTQDQ